MSEHVQFFSQERLDVYAEALVKVLVRGGMDEKEAISRVKYMLTHSPYEEEE